MSDTPKSQPSQPKSQPPAKPTPMTGDDAARIQAHADRVRTNADFKARAQRAAADNAAKGRGQN
ncbi:MAG: hypothetical protein JNJ59_11780 [Deltaproteobacteria bacterium]|nr:hypothetical protein [Deltaproteobacteria bacterium]